MSLSIGQPIQSSGRPLERRIPGALGGLEAGSTFTVLPSNFDIDVVVGLLG